MLPENDSAGANPALPLDGPVYVCWPGKGGRAARTIYRWRRDSARKLANALMAVGASRVWFMMDGSALSWDEREGMYQPNRDLIERAFNIM